MVLVLACFGSRPALASVPVPVDLAERKATFTILSTALLDAIQMYATANAASTTFEGICYNPNVGAYWFATVGGVCQDGVANAPAASVSFSSKMNPKLVKATFNYHWVAKCEPAAWAHNYAYVMQVLHDSIVDLGFTPPIPRPE